MSLMDIIKIVAKCWNITNINGLIITMIMMFIIVEILIILFCKNEEMGFGFFLFLNIGNLISTIILSPLLFGVFYACGFLLNVIIKYWNIILIVLSIKILLYRFFIHNKRC